MKLDLLESHVRDWKEMATIDPLRAILVKNKHWKLPDFFATANARIDQLFSISTSIGRPMSFGRVLEFGCGVGRFLPHFEKHFNEVWGVDVSQEMIDLAKKYNPKCRFYLTLPQI